MVRRSSPYLATDFVQLVADDLALAFRLGEDVVVVGDLAHELVVLVEDLLTFQGGQSAQLHGEDGVGLHLVHVKQVHKAVRAVSADSEARMRAMT